MSKIEDGRPMTARHTPGPLNVVESRTFPSRSYVHEIKDAEGQTLATLCGAAHDDREAMEAQAADARLYASAPDLLAALRRIVDAMPWVSDYSDDTDPRRVATKIARAAIAKATGGAA